MRGFFRCVASVCAGVGMWAAFPDMSLWWLLVPSLALMLWVLDGVSLRLACFCGLLFGGAFWFPLVQWAQISAGGVLPWVALALSQSLFWVLWAWCVAVVSRLSWVRSLWGYPVAMALLWVGCEQLRSRVPFSGFPWGNIAYPQVDAPVGSLAFFGGESLVSAAVVVVAALLRMALARGVLFPALLRNELWRLVCVCVAVGLYVLPVAFSIPGVREQGSITVGAVQGGIEAPGAQTYRVEGKVTQNHVEETFRLLNEGYAVDLLVWGEGALDRDPRVSELVNGKVGAVVERAGVPLMVGFSEFDRDNGVIYNRYGVWDDKLGLSSVLYGKQIPVPFGEYIPFRSLISRLATEAAQVSVDMAAAQNSARYDVVLADGRVVPVGVGICFEVGYESLWREAVVSGAQIFISPSNNYHFRSSPEPAQQAQMARFRAMEFARSMVGVSTTGESVMVRPNGGVQAVSARHSHDFLVAELPLRESLSPAVFLAVPLAWVMMVGAGIVVFDGVVHAVIVALRSRRRA